MPFALMWHHGIGRTAWCAPLGVPALHYTQRAPLDGGAGLAPLDGGAGLALRAEGVFSSQSIVQPDEHGRRGNQGAALLLQAPPGALTVRAAADPVAVLASVDPAPGIVVVHIMAPTPPVHTAAVAALPGPVLPLARLGRGPAVMAGQDHAGRGGGQDKVGVPAMRYAQRAESPRLEPKYRTSMGGGGTRGRPCYCRPHQAP